MPEEEEVVETELGAAVAVAVAAAVEVTALELGPELEIEPGPFVKPVGPPEIELRHLVGPASAAAWLEHQLQKAWMPLWLELEWEWVCYPEECAWVYQWTYWTMLLRAVRLDHCQ